MENETGLILPESIFKDGIRLKSMFLPHASSTSTPELIDYLFSSFNSPWKKDTVAPLPVKKLFESNI